MTMDVLDRLATPDTRVSVSGAAVKLLGLTKEFGDHRVLKGIDLTIRPGQFVAVVGRSGCGKSTLLRLIAGLDEPSAGSIAVDDEAGGDRDVVRLMFQEPRLLPWQRVAANVAVGLGHAAGRQVRRAQAAAALREVGLAGRDSAWPSVLSGGQKQRVALARALVSHPRLLLLDEPLGALDALTRIEMQDLIERVWQQKGFTAIVVTHDVSEAVMLADRILLLEDGDVALDVAVALPRPRLHGDPEAAAIEGEILKRLLRRQQ
jgi:sulfonate transport system ATP-binding protein